MIPGQDARGFYRLNHMGSLEHCPADSACMDTEPEQGSPLDVLPCILSLPRL